MYRNFCLVDDISVGNSEPSSLLWNLVCYAAHIMWNILTIYNARWLLSISNIVQKCVSKKIISEFGWITNLMIG